VEWQAAHTAKQKYPVMRTDWACRSWQVGQLQGPAVFRRSQRRPSRRLNGYPIGVPVEGANLNQGRTGAEFGVQLSSRDRAEREEEPQGASRRRFGS